MSAYKLEKMKEIYFGFTEDFKLALSIVRIYGHTDLSKVDKVHKKGLTKSMREAIKSKDKLKKQETKHLKSADKSLFGKGLEDFGYEVEILAYDLENADYQIENTKVEIQSIKDSIHGLSKGKKKSATKQLDKLKAQTLMYCIAREKIKFYYDSISNNAKFGYKAIKIRKIYDKQTSAQVASLDRQIARQTKILNTPPKVKKSKNKKEVYA
ncbi:MAG: hypothetical protein R3Y13_05980 [bacterium]